MDIELLHVQHMFLFSQLSGNSATMILINKNIQIDAAD